MVFKDLDRNASASVSFSSCLLKCLKLLTKFKIMDWSTPKILTVACAISVLYAVLATPVHHFLAVSSKEDVKNLVELLEKIAVPFDEGEGKKYFCRLESPDMKLKIFRRLWDYLSNYIKQTEELCSQVKKKHKLFYSNLTLLFKIRSHNYLE